MKLHNHIDYCLFCDNKNIDSSVENWKKLINNSLVKEKIKLEEILKDILNSLNKLLENKELNINFIPKIIETSEIIKQKIINNIENLEKNYEACKLVVDIKKDKIKVEEEQIYADIINYLLNEHISEYFSPFVEKNAISEEIETLNEKLIKENENTSKNLINKVKEISKEIGLEKDIFIGTDTRGKMPKISLIVSNDKTEGIRSLSEGQRHKLSLVVFFAKIALSNKKYKYIVLDDPMVSMDIITYHKLRNYILSNLSSKSEKFILLTHNFYFLVFMLSNVFINSSLKDKTTLMNLSSDKCEKIDLNLIVKDDILLFKESFCKSETIDDLSL